VYHLTMVSFFPVLGLAIGLGAAQVGLARGLYSGINAVGRPMLVVLIKRLSLRQVTFIGIILQTAMLALLPAAGFFIAVLAIFIVFASARACVVVSNSSGLAEEVDETRVSRGVATSTFSAVSDVSNIVAPLIAGLVATYVGVHSMFPLLAVGALICFLALDTVIQRWKHRSTLPAAAV
jgi:MFS family permease